MAITGVFGAGKSTVAEIFRQRGVPVISCDAIVHELYGRRDIVNRIRRLFGAGVLDADGNVDRKKLAGLVFRDRDARERLEQLVHPKVFARIRKDALDAARKGCTIVAVEIPLLHETHTTEEFDAVITVHTPAALIRKRLRSSCTSRDIAARWRAQAPAREKVKFSDYTIDNSGSPASTRRQVDAVLCDLVRSMGDRRIHADRSRRRKRRWNSRRMN